jgi:hypothetical protein
VEKWNIGLKKNLPIIPSFQHTNIRNIISTLKN